LLAPALALTLSSRRPTGVFDNEMGIGWGIMKVEDDEMVWHEGGTGGYTAFIGFLVKKKVGVALLSNSYVDVGVADIGMHLLNPAIPLAFPSIPAR